MELIRLSDAIENLREEIRVAQKRAKKKNLQFNVGPIELELEVIAEKEAGASGKVNWWIFGGGAEAKAKGASKHKIKLTLEAIDSATGESAKVSQETEEPAE